MTTHPKAVSFENWICASEDWIHQCVFLNNSHTSWKITMNKWIWEIMISGNQNFYHTWTLLYTSKKKCIEILNNLPSLLSDLTQKYSLPKSHRFCSRTLDRHKSYQTVITSLKSTSDWCSIVLCCVYFSLLGNRRIV